MANENFHLFMVQPGLFCKKVLMAYGTKAKNRFQARKMNVRLPVYIIRIITSSRLNTIELASHL
jgi:hypothetical protein